MESDLIEGLEVIAMGRADDPIGVARAYLRTHKESEENRRTAVRGDIHSLVDSFPALRGRARWIGDDSKAFKKCMRGMSSGERHAALFVLYVWNHFENKFDFDAAINSWDNNNLAAFRDWLKNPWFK